MSLRDEIEATLRAWHACEINRGSPADIDLDCHPIHEEPEPADNRLEVYRALGDPRARAEDAGAVHLLNRLDADRAYLGAVLGERLPLADYIPARGHPSGGTKPAEHWPHSAST